MRHCSDACRGVSAGSRDEELEAAILTLLSERGRDKTICPSEAAKLAAAEEGGWERTPPQTVWQPLMVAARAAARRLAARGKIVITQRGAVVDPDTAKGPIRLRLR